MLKAVPDDPGFAIWISFLYAGFDQVLPAFRFGHLVFRQQLGVVSVTQHAGVDRRLEILVLLGDALRPIVQVRDVGRLVGLEQPFCGQRPGRCRFGGVIHVGTRIALFGADLGQALAVRAADEDCLLARGLLVGRLHRLAPVDLVITQDRHFLRVRRSGGCPQQQATGQCRQHRATDYRKRSMLLLPARYAQHRRVLANVPTLALVTDRCEACPRRRSRTRSLRWQ